MFGTYMYIPFEFQVNYSGSMLNIRRVFRLEHPKKYRPSMSTHFLHRLQLHVIASFGEVGRLQEALAMFQEVLEVQRQVLGPRHPDTLATQHNVASSLGEAGRDRDCF